MKRIYRQDAIDLLETYLRDMDVPVGRYRDYFWLSRNLAIRNREHPNFMDAIRIIKQLQSPSHLFCYLVGFILWIILSI